MSRTLGSTAIAIAAAWWILAANAAEPASGPPTAPAATQPTMQDYAGRIRAQLPKGWSVVVDGDVLRITRDQQVRGRYTGPCGPGIAPGEDPYELYHFEITLRVRQRITLRERQQQEIENDCTAALWRVEHPQDPGDKPISPPIKHVLPSHYNDTHSFWLSCWQVGDWFGFESKDTARECKGVYDTVEKLFKTYDAPATEPATQPASDPASRPAQDLTLDLGNKVTMKLRG